MTKMVIDRGMEIDDAERVLFEIRGLSGKRLDSLDIVKKFISRETNTRFYLDSNLNSSMQQMEKCVYVWLDTGFTDCYGSPILVSLLKGAEGFTGHFTGTVETLSESARRFFGISRNIAEQKTESFSRKYAAKIQSRSVKHIEDEQKYLFDCLNQHDGVPVIAEKLALAGFHVDDRDTDERCAGTISGGDEECIETSAADTGMTKFEEEITVGLLLEKMEGMQKYMDELVAELQKVSSESKARIQELQEKNAEYKRAILQMREYTGTEAKEANPSETENTDRSGHGLLGRHGKILVIGGQELGVKVMHGIAKQMGFEKGDFEFVDYDKAKDFADRIRKNGRYSAVIVGACPHKTAASAGYSSTVEKLKSIEGMPFTVDARCKSGRLKVTKESFREALSGVCENLKLGYAC